MCVNYYDLPQVSNSDLTALARACNALPDNREELEDVFNFGSLVDAMLTESFRLSYGLRTLTDEYGRVTYYTQEVWDQASTMVRQARKDKVISMALKQMIGQYVFVRRFVFTFGGLDEYLMMRCKFDQYHRALRMGMEYKTTSCRTKKQFREAVDHFHWDRAAHIYINLGRAESHWIKGISKETGEIFTIAVNKGHEIYTNGGQKAAYWCNKWNILIPNFKAHETSLLQGKNEHVLNAWHA